MESSCCSEAVACASDGACYVCLKTNDAAADCAKGAARRTLATCIATKCKDECAGTGLDRGAEEPAAAADAGADDAGVAPPVEESGCTLSRTSKSSDVGAAAFGAFAMGIVVRRRRSKSRH
jgi:hypothetical protein